jgi:hypothetical protein
MVTGATGEQLAKRMVKLAWDASRVFGWGAFQDRGPGMTEAQLWERGCDNNGPHTAKGDLGTVYADYLFGRMMKLLFTYGPDYVEARPQSWRADYQSFCHRYPHFPALAKAAAESLGTTVSESVPATA